MVSAYNYQISLGSLEDSRGRNLSIRSTFPNIRLIKSLNWRFGWFDQ